MYAFSSVTVSPVGTGMGTLPMRDSFGGLSDGGAVRAVAGAAARRTRGEGRSVVCIWGRRGGEGEEGRAEKNTRAGCEEVVVAHSLFFRFVHTPATPPASPQQAEPNALL